MTPAPQPAALRSPLANWSPLIGVFGWCLGLVLGGFLAWKLAWSPGEVVIAGSVWLLVLLICARQLLRDLFGPVFVYEVVRVGRRKSTFIFRWIYIALVVGLLALLYYAWWIAMERYHSRGTIPTVRLAEFATTYFEVVAVVQFVVVILLTPGYVAATITNEKERQTLEFLLATDLKNREIIFGKLAARTLTLAMYVLAGLPVLAFLQLFGGIDPDQAMAAAAAALIAVVGLSALSLAMSTALKKSRDAIAVTYILILGYHAISFTLGVIVYEWARHNEHLTDLGFMVINWQTVSNWIAAGNLLFVYPTQTAGRTIDGAVIARMLGGFAIFWGVVTVVSLIYAVTRLRIVALKQGHGEPRATPSVKVASSRPDLGRYPVLWKEVFAGSSPPTVMTWVFRLVMVLLLAVIPGIAAYNSFFERPNYYWNPLFSGQFQQFQRAISSWLRVATGVLTTFILFNSALRGAAAIAGERDKDTWLSLISAPVSSSEVLFGKWIGCMLSMRFAFVMLLLTWTFGLIIQAIHPLMLILTIGLIALYNAAFSWIGIYCSLISKTTLGASIRAFAAALFFAGGFWLLFGLCCLLPVNISGVGSGGPDRPIQHVATLLIGGTPPFMAGWAPMMRFDRDGLGPFHPREPYSWGPISPFLGILFWIAFTAILGVICSQKLKVLMNRVPRSPTTVTRDVPDSQREK